MACMNSASLSHHFLIAMPNKVGEPFTKTVSYVCEHSNNGTIAIVINRPLGPLKIGDLLKQKDLNSNSVFSEQPVLFGGPVEQERGFVMHLSDEKWRSTLTTPLGIGITTSRDILEAMASKDGKQTTPYLVLLGYASWAPGQLEQEMMRDCWITGPVDTAILFDIPFKARWAAAMRAAGVDPDKLSLFDPGHA